MKIYDIHISVFKSTVLLECSHAYLKSVKLYFLSCFGCNYIIFSVLHLGPQSLNYLLFGCLQKKFANPPIDCVVEMSRLTYLTHRPSMFLFYINKIV